MERMKICIKGKAQVRRATLLRQLLSYEVTTLSFKYFSWNIMSKPTWFIRLGLLKLCIRFSNSNIKHMLHLVRMIGVVV